MYTTGIILIKHVHFVVIILNTTNIYSNRAILCVFFITFLIKCCELLSRKYL